MVIIKRVAIQCPDFLSLVRNLDKDLNSRYGTLQDNYNQFNKVESLDAAVVGYLDNQPVACGGFRKLKSDMVEIKRMFVIPEQRGNGIAAKILEELEQWAREEGYTRAVLETGVGQPEAIRFYTKLGYRSIDNYGQYLGNANSVCLGKSF